MISWLQLNMQRHFRVVFIVLLVVIIIAFVFTIGNQGSFSGVGEGQERRFFGYPLTTQVEEQRFNQDARLSALFQGNMRMNQLYAFERATALHVAEQHSLPQPTDEQFQEYLTTRPVFQGPDGQFDPQSYNMMLDNLRLAMGVSNADIRRVLMDDYRIEKAYAVLGGTGHVDTSAVLEALQQRGTKWSVMVASKDLTSYNPEIEVSDAELQAYFEENQLRYTTPVRRSVDYVELDANQFVDQIKPNEDELIAYFEDNRQRYQPPQQEQQEPEEDGEETEPQESVTFEQARSQVRADLRLERARHTAYERASDLVLHIIENNIANDSAELESLVEDYDAELKTTPHFAQGETPIGTTWGRAVVDEAFKLSDSQYYSEPVQVGNKVVVLFYNDQIESILPSFETVKDRVAQDYRSEQLRQRRDEHARQLRESLTAAAENEEGFAAAAEENGFTVQSHQDFTLLEPAENLDTRLLSSLVNLAESEVSQLVRTGGPDTATYIYVVSKDVPEVSENDEEYAQILPAVRSQYRSAAADQYINKLMAEEAARQRISLSVN